MGFSTPTTWGNIEHERVGIRRNGDITNKDQKHACGINIFLKYSNLAQKLKL